MGEHTPGPWKAELRRGHAPTVRYVITAPEADRGAVVSKRGVRSALESKANARLITAAPEMFAMCEEMYSMLTEDARGPIDFRAKLGLLIRKAKGET